MSLLYFYNLVWLQYSELMTNSWECDNTLRLMCHSYVVYCVRYHFSVDCIQDHVIYNPLYILLDAQLEVVKGSTRVLSCIQWRRPCVISDIVSIFATANYGAFIWLLEASWPLTLRKRAVLIPTQATVDPIMARDQWIYVVVHFWCCFFYSRSAIAFLWRTSPSQPTARNEPLCMR